VKIEYVSSAGAMQIARVFSYVYITGEGIFEQKRRREEIYAYQHGILNRKGCHTPLNKLNGCDYKRTNVWRGNHSVTAAFHFLHDSESMMAKAVVTERSLGTD